MGTVTFILYFDAVCVMLVSTFIEVFVFGFATFDLYTALASGILRWWATYFGDANNNAAGLGACGDSTESTMLGYPGAHIALSKSANSTSGPAPLAVTYTYVLTNDGSDVLFHATVSDDGCGLVTIVSGDVNNNQLLDLAEVWTLT